MPRKRTKKKIDTETQFLWKLIFDILLIPISLLLMLFGKKKKENLFLPIKDITTFLTEAKFTFAIIVINFFMFFVEFFLPASTLQSLFHYSVDLFILQRLYSFITAGFIHASISHLFANMLGIFIFGRVVERKLGASKTALIFFGALLLSHIFSSLIYLFVLKTNVAGVGASGALMGLVAAAILLSPFYITYELLFPLPIMLVGWLTIYSDIGGILNNIDSTIGYVAHLGGFLSITLIAFLLKKKERKELQKGFLINLGSLAVAVLYLFTRTGA